MKLRDLLDQRVVLFAPGLEDHIVVVDTADRLVRGNHHDVALVGVPELLRLRFGRAGHAGQLFEEPEVVLDRDRGERLGFPLHVDVFLGFDRLVEPIGVPATRHEPSGELIHDQDLSFLDDVFHILLVQGVRPQKLKDVVDALAPLRVDPLQVAFLRDLLARLQTFLLVDRAELGGKIGKQEEIPVTLRKELPALLREIDRMVLLVDRIEELLVRFLHPLVAQKLELDALDETLQPRFIGEQLSEALVLRRAAFDLQKLEPRFPFLLGVLADGLGVGQDPVHELPLRAHEPLHVRFHLVVLLDAVLHGPRNDEGRARLVDQDRVDLVDDGVMVAPLDAVLPMSRHVVAQVVEAELVVRAVGDVTGIGGSALGEIHSVLNAANRQPQKLIYPSHPFAVAPGQIVVHGDEVDAFPAEGIQVDGHRCDEGLALAGRHLGDLPVVEHDGPQKLDVEGHHVPRNRNAADVPGLPHETAARLLHDGERLGEEDVLGLTRLETGAEVRRLQAERLIR